MLREPVTVGFMGIKQYRIEPATHEASDMIASYNMELLWTGPVYSAPVRSNVNHIDGNDLFSLENTAEVLEAALAAREKKERV